MGLVVKSITISGFISYGPDPVTLMLDGAGAVAIVGDNGAGKSTLISKALTWSLYGKCPPERMGSSTRALSGRAIIGTGQKVAWVETVLQDNVGRVWVVRRQRAKSGSDSIDLWLDGVEQEAADQTTIDSVIGADYETFCRTVVRGQSDPWSFAEATDKRKREILDSISGGAALERAWERAKGELSQSDVSVRDADRKVEDLSARLSSLDAQAVFARLATWDIEHKQKLSAIRSDIKALKKAEKLAVAHDSKIDDNQVLLDEIQSREPALDRKPYREAIEQGEADYRKAYAAWEHCKREYEKLSALSLGDPCPTCQQPVGPIVVNKVGEASKALDASSVHVGIVQGEVSGYKKTLTDAEGWLSSEHRSWQQEIEAVPVESQQAPAAKRETQAAIQRLSDLEGVVNPHKSAYEREFASEQSVRKELAVAKALVECAKWRSDAARAWVEALGPKGARAHMAESALSAIESAANRWLTVLSDRRLSIEFPATREVKGAVRDDIKTIVRIDDNGKETVRDLLSFSGGERRRINLAVDLGVAAACTGGGLALSLLVLDEEVFSGMDEHGKAAVVLALQEAGVSDVVVIDHDPRLSSTLPRTVIVSRGGPNSYSKIREVNNE